MTSPLSYSNRRVYWPSQETITDFLPTSTNTAGWFDLSTDGVLVCGRAVRGQTLLWTTTDVWTASYIGGDLLYAFQRVGNNCGILAQNAVVVLDTGAYWMGSGKFFHYDGFAQTLDCEVTDYVFGDFNATYAGLVWAVANPKFNEVTWYYPSAASVTPDRYVTYNYVEAHWVFGVMSRTCGVTQQPGAVPAVPVLIDASGNIYDHETGDTRSGATIYLESGPLEAGDGDHVARIQRVVPDDKSLGDVSLSLYTAMYPDGTETLNGPYTAANPTSVRLTARQVRLRVTEVAATAWRIGVIRLGIIMAGRR